MIGYYHVTLEASLMYILEIKHNDFLKDTKEVIRNSFLPNKNNFTKGIIDKDYQYINRKSYIY